MFGSHFWSAIRPGNTFRSLLFDTAIAAPILENGNMGNSVDPNYRIFMESPKFSM
jgi:hypothetical protein